MSRNPEKIVQMRNTGTGTPYWAYRYSKAVMQSRSIYFRLRLVKKFGSSFSYFFVQKNPFHLKRLVLPFVSVAVCQCWGSGAFYRIPDLFDRIRNRDEKIFGSGIKHPDLHPGIKHPDPQHCRFNSFVNIPVHDIL
jgi:hypothetical protein